MLQLKVYESTAKEEQFFLDLYDTEPIKLTISIEDNGKGFIINTDKNGIGIKNMNSRIQQIGGYLSIDSQINKGTSVLISLPI